MIMLRVGNGADVLAICVLIFNILQLMWECCQPIQGCIDILRSVSTPLPQSPFVLSLG